MLFSFTAEPSSCQEFSQPTLRTWAQFSRPRVIDHLRSILAEAGFGVFSQATSPQITISISVRTGLTSYLVYAHASDHEQLACSSRRLPLLLVNKLFLFFCLHFVGVICFAHFLRPEILGSAQSPFLSRCLEPPFFRFVGLAAITTVQPPNTSLGSPSRHL